MIIITGCMIITRFFIASYYLIIFIAEKNESGCWQLHARNLAATNSALRGHVHSNFTNVSSPPASSNSEPAQSTRPSNTNSRPLQLVGNQELGPDWCEVKITVAMKFDEQLIRLIGSLKLFGQAVGSSIALPQHLV